MHHSFGLRAQRSSTVYVRAQSRRVFGVLQSLACSCAGDVFPGLGGDIAQSIGAETHDFAVVTVGLGFPGNFFAAKQFVEEDEAGVRGELGAGD